MGDDVVSSDLLVDVCRYDGVYFNIAALHRRQQENKMRGRSGCWW